MFEGSIKKSQKTAVDGKYDRWRWRYINDEMGSATRHLPSKRIKESIWMHGCTGQWRENNQFSSWAVLLTNCLQIKRCTITDYWLFSCGWEGGCSPSHRLSPNMPPFMFTWVALHSEWLSCVLHITDWTGKRQNTLQRSGHTALSIDSAGFNVLR